MDKLIKFFISWLKAFVPGGYFLTFFLFAFILDISEYQNKTNFYYIKGLIFFSIITVIFFGIMTALINLLEYIVPKGIYDKYVKKWYLFPILVLLAGLLLHDLLESGLLNWLFFLL